MIVDFDDVYADHDGMDLLRELKKANPAFKVTLFAVPALGSPTYWNGFPAWCELAMHGHLHPDPYECANWSYERMAQALEDKPARFVRGWKSPGWQSSDEVFRVLRDFDWWCADHPENNGRRPAGLRTHVLGQDDHLHGHIGWNGSGNDLAANFDMFRARVAAADLFQFVSEAVRPWAGGLSYETVGARVA